MTMAGILLRARSQEKTQSCMRSKPSLPDLAKSCTGISRFFLGLQWFFAFPNFLPKKGNLGDLESTDANYRPQFSIFAKSSGGPWAG